MVDVGHLQSWFVVTAMFSICGAGCSTTGGAAVTPDDTEVSQRQVSDLDQAPSGEAEKSAGLESADAGEPGSAQSVADSCLAGKRDSCEEALYLLSAPGVGDESSSFDPELSVAVAEKGCNMGVPDACYWVVTHLIFDPDHYREMAAREVLTTGCDEGVATDCIGAAIAMTLEFGADDAAVDPYLEKLCEMGFEPICSLREEYDEDLAAGLIPLAHLEALCHGEEPQACGSLARRYRLRLFAPADREKASVLANLGCERADWASCLELSELYRSGFLGDDGSREQRALQLLKKACEIDEGSEACLTLAGYLEDGPEKTRDVDEARTLYRGICGGDVGEACLSLGQLEYRRENFEEAREFFERACQLGRADGCVQVGHGHRYDEGDDQDLQEALSFYDRACQMGSERGCKLWGRLTRLLDCIDEGLGECGARISQPVPADCGSGELMNPMELDEEQWEGRVGGDITELRDLDTSVEFAAEVCTPAGQRVYLRSLHCNDGSPPISFRRMGSVGPGGRCDNIIDLYEVICPEADYEVYLDMYVCPK